MDQELIGRYIAQKRKEKNITQAQLAQCLGVSNKTVSKWETGQHMPDYSAIQPLCRALGVMVTELMEGADQNERPLDEETILDLIKRTQALEQDKRILHGLLLIVMGLVFLALHFFYGGSAVRDFISGLLLGIAVAEMLVGVYITMRGLSEKKNR
ncbi:MAG: helix-turn-helix domain-containing protein [Oscillospiraceae bacterium]|nr:helix-turn-helix domain-containing protein [Oscillospiraceae bacterium]